MVESFEEYYEDRYKNQRDWYDKKAVKNKLWYLRLRVGVLILAAGIPTAISFLPGSSSDSWIIQAVTVMSFLLLVFEGSLSLFNFHEKWQNYRTTAESLKKEGQFFETRTGEYKDADDPEALFVERVENLVSQEHRYWKMISKKPKGDGKL